MAMMAVRSLHPFAGLLAASFGTLASASPPPPPPEFVQKIAEQLVIAPTEANFAGYSALLANDLRVTLNGHIIASTRGDWLSAERARLGKVDRFVYGFSADNRSVLILDRIDDRSDEHCWSGGKCVFDPRWVARAVRYEVGSDRLVHQIRILQTNSIMQTPTDRQ